MVTGGNRRLPLLAAALPLLAPTGPDRPRQSYRPPMSINVVQGHSKVAHPHFACLIPPPLAWRYRPLNHYWTIPWRIE